MNNLQKFNSLNDVNLTLDQFNTLSWLATSLLSVSNKKYEVVNTRNMDNNWFESRRIEISLHETRIEGIESVCHILEIDSMLILNVKHYQFRAGLRNFNKLSEIVYFE